MCARESFSAKIAGRVWLGLVATALLALAGIGIWSYRQLLRPASQPAKPRTIEDVIRVLGPHVDRRLRPAFQRAGISMPPEQLTLLALKEEKRLEIYAADGSRGPSRSSSPTRFSRRAELPVPSCAKVINRSPKASIGLSF